jgi:deferrochelatase/peroxidase EfeB
MAVDLKRPTFSWHLAAGADLEMLEALQPNILTSHVRTHLQVLLIAFTDRDQGRTFLHRLADPPISKSARTHLTEKAAHRADPKYLGTPYVGVGLAADGYRALGVDTLPSDRAFLRGMKHRTTRTRLHDPGVRAWEPAYAGQIHAILLVGAATPESVFLACGQIAAVWPPSVRLLGAETGQAWANRQGQSAEHFGFADGASEPVFLAEDLQFQEQCQGVTTKHWDPQLPLGRILVPDPAAPDPGVHHGSYLVYRKLEQDVRAFQLQTRTFAAGLAAAGMLVPKPAGQAPPEVAGAMVVGRFADGTSILERKPSGDAIPGNDFNYATDPSGMTCPLWAHVRKVNPRSSSSRVQLDRQVLMARRGQTYGARGPEPEPGADQTAYPSGGVGLLFMALNASLVQQFEFVQGAWANSSTEPKAQQDGNDLATPLLTGGQDQLIGQTPRRDGRGRVGVPRHLGEQPSTPVDPMVSAVTLKGGEYFFMPSLAFLRAL